MYRPSRVGQGQLQLKRAGQPMCPVYPPLYTLIGRHRLQYPEHIVGQAGCKSGPLYYPVRLHVAQLSVLDYGTEVLYRTIIELYASRQKQAGVQFASTVGGSA
jgi:hypothetical protein